jgi:hypothetical protein
MTTYYRVPSPQSRSSRRVPILAAAASGLVAVAAIGVTLAGAGGGGGEAVSPSPNEAAVHAHPDRATFYQRSVETQRPAPAIDGKRAAERFHHFR